METIIAIFGLISFLFCGGIAAIRWVAKRSKRGLKSVGRKVDVSSTIVAETCNRAFDGAVFSHIFGLFKKKAKAEVKVAEAQADVAEAQADVAEANSEETLAKAEKALKKAKQQLLKREQELLLLEQSLQAYQGFAEYEKVKKVF